MNQYRLPDENESPIQVNESHPLYLISQSKAGIPMHSVKKLQDTMHFTNKEISSFLHLSESTFQRLQKQSNTLLDTDTSEKTLELQALINYGTEVFGSVEALKSWLEEPNFALNSQKPIELLASHIGMQYVLTLLRRIAFGIYS